MILSFLIYNSLIKIEFILTGYCHDGGNIGLTSHYDTDVNRPGGEGLWNGVGSLKGLDFSKGTDSLPGKGF